MSIADNLTPEEKQLQLMAAIGRQVVDFSRTKAFEYLLDQAMEMREDALEALADVSPADSARIMELQVQARTGEKFQQWIQEAVASGEQAEKEFVEGRQHRPD